MSSERNEEEDDDKESYTRYKNNRKKNHNYFDKVVRWMAKSITDDHIATVDPSVWLHSHDVDGACVTQRCLQLHRAEFNDLDKPSVPYLVVPLLNSEQDYQIG